MQKLKIIATISFLILVVSGCSKGSTGGPKMQVGPGDSSEGATLSLTDESGRVVYTYQMGPFSLPARTSAGNIPTTTSGFNFGVEEPAWITSFEPRIEDAEGNALPNELVRQLILVNHAEENTFCTTKQTGNPFAAVTSSMEKIELPEGHGYLLMPEDPLEANVTLRNPTDEDIHGIFIEFVLVGEPVADTKMISDVKPLLIDLDPCEHKPVSIAPGQFVEKSKEVFAPETGSVVKAYGLLQNFGVSVALYANDEDEPFWQGVAEIDENYKITGLEPFEDPAGVPFKRGEKLSMTVAYDNVSDEWFDEATGAVMVYLARDEEEPTTSSPAETEEESSSEEVAENEGAENEGVEEKASAISVQSKLLLINSVY